jgi:glycosyltransferase involved in cell wall biosynthesis
MDEHKGVTPADAAAAEPYRPLVTFALFAYNQEKFIREAIEGAFAQTYEPLEIVLSDDCSNDRTFAIMQDMAASYQGSHRVRAVRNDFNFGVTPHVLARGREASGEIVVVAAGDDVSKPHRVERHVMHYRDPDVCAVTGSYDLVDEHGRILSVNQKSPVVIARGLPYKTYMKTETEVIQGSTASYRRDTFGLPLPDLEIIISEDNLFSFLIPANGWRISYESEPLILYRQHDGALGNRRTRLPALEREKRISLACREGRNRLLVFLSIYDVCSRPEAVDWKEIMADLERSADLVDWSSLSFRRRVVSALRSMVLGDLRNTRWKFARIFGNYPLYQPRIFLVSVIDRLRIWVARNNDF